MKRKNLLVVSILTLTVLASSSAMAFANTDTAATSTTDTKTVGHNGGTRVELNLTDAQKALLSQARTSDLKTALGNLVTAGTIKQAEADAILAAVPADQAGRGDGPFQNLTEKQKTALKTELETLKATSLKELVADGTITQTQADVLAKQGPSAKHDGTDRNR